VSECNEEERGGGRKAHLEFPLADLVVQVLDDKLGGLALRATDSSRTIETGRKGALRSSRTVAALRNLVETGVTPLASL
jgi:hypothetical protein